MCSLCCACLPPADVVNATCAGAYCSGRFHSLFECSRASHQRTRPPALGAAPEAQQAAQVAHPSPRSCSARSHRSCGARRVRSASRPRSRTSMIKALQARSAASAGWSDARPSTSRWHQVKLVAGTTPPTDASIAAESLIGTRVGSMLNLIRAGLLANASCRCTRKSCDCARKHRISSRATARAHVAALVGSRTRLVSHRRAQSRGSSRLSHRLELEAPMLSAEPRTVIAKWNRRATALPLALHFRPATSDSATRLMAAFVAAVDNTSSVHDQSVCVWLVAFCRPILSTACDADAVMNNVNGETDDEDANQPPSTSRERSRARARPTPSERRRQCDSVAILRWCATNPLLEARVSTRPHVVRGWGRGSPLGE